MIELQRLDGWVIPNRGGREELCEGELYLDVVYLMIFHSLTCVAMGISGISFRGRKAPKEGRM